MSLKKRHLNDKIKVLVDNGFVLKKKHKCRRAKTLPWLKWATTLQAIGQNGLTYTKNPFDKERYHQLIDIAAQMMAYQSHHRHRQVKALFEHERHYATPKIDVRGAVFNQANEILLVKELDGDWSLPGGWCDVNYSPGESVVKEIKEETGFDVEIIKLTGVLDKLKHDHPPQLPHSYKCFFLCSIIGGKAQISIETTGVEFFALNELPNISLHRVTRAQIDRCFEHYQNNSLPTDYD